MYKINKIIFVGLCISLTGFCFAKGKNDSKQNGEPEWVIRPSSVYPNENYLTSVGYGSDRNTAESEAVKGIASIFSQKVTSKGASSNKMEQAKKDGEISTAQVQNFNQNILREISEDDLIGIEIKEYWFDKKDTWYAIAVLNKDNTSKLYEDSIQKNQKLIEKIIASATDEKSFANYSRYNYAEAIADFNEEYLERLSVVNPTEGTSLRKLCTASNELKAKKIAIAKSISICVVIENDVNGRFASAFADVITDKGFHGCFDLGSRYLLSGKVVFTKSETKDGKTVHSRYTLDSYLTDTNTGKQLVPFSISGREAHYDYTKAEERATNEIEKKIREVFKTEFEDYMDQYNAK